MTYLEIFSPDGEISSKLSTYKTSLRQIRWGLFSKCWIGCIGLELLVDQTYTVTAAPFLRARKNGACWWWSCLYGFSSFFKPLSANWSAHFPHRWKVLGSIQAKACLCLSLFWRGLQKSAHQVVQRACELALCVPEKDNTKLMVVDLQNNTCECKQHRK